MESKKTYLWLPVLVVITLIVGFITGNYFSGANTPRKLFPSSGNKIDVILDIINDEYVDSVNMQDLIEGAIPKIISELDPHSVYIPAEDLQSVNEEMEGHFSGIGVQFNVQNDTVMIVSVISGGPSEKVGLQAGDRIITIEDSLFVGPGINADKVVKNLKGEKGTTVKVGIKRLAADTLQHYTITRDDIPVNTVDVAYKVTDKIGLIKINKFGRTTYNEFVISLAKLLSQGCDSFILDLRGNQGGFLDAAVNIVNEFFSGGELIVYTEGKAFPRNDAIANGTGACKTNPVVVLMDEWSASSSEILAGAIQDNDRGLIIGRRSFGKGLVQNQITLSDKSALRLTIARYYTASGRSIQKSYELGKSSEYERDIITRFTHGEFDSADSIKNEGEKFETMLGRPVYSGGGIMPDIFIPRDTIGITSYYSSLYNNGIFYQYAFQYSDQNREKLNEFKDWESLYAYLKKQPLLNGVVLFAESKGIRRRPFLINISAKPIENITHALIVRNIMGDNGFYPVLFSSDPVVLKAVEVIEKGEAFPKAPVRNKENI